ncbi:MAG: hypothetical protein LM573_02220 [Thermofilum sp.]|jgi:hypothetical protein|nr:hypothetical protein [Thermofilum sp.]
MVLGLEQPLPVMDSDDEVLRAMRKLSEYKSNLESALYSEFLYRRSDVENLKLLIQQFLGKFQAQRHVGPVWMHSVPLPPGYGSVVFTYYKQVIWKARAMGFRFSFIMKMCV